MIASVNAPRREPCSTKSDDVGRLAGLREREQARVAQVDLRAEVDGERDRVAERRQPGEQGEGVDAVGGRVVRGAVSGHPDQADAALAELRLRPRRGSRGCRRPARARPAARGSRSRKSSPGLIGSESSTARRRRPARARARRRRRPRRRVRPARGAPPPRPVVPGRSVTAAIASAGSIPSAPRCARPSARRAVLPASTPSARRETPPETSISDSPSR